MHPQTVSSLSRQLTQVMNELFVSDKKRPNQKKSQQDIAWEEHNAPVEDLDMELDDILEDSTLDGPILSTTTDVFLEDKLALIKNNSRKKLQKLLFIGTTIALIAYLS